MLSIGQQAPSFEAESTQGRVRLGEYFGKQPVVLIFYPKDETPICTKQLCAVRDSAARYAEFNALVLGINPGSIDEHERFAQKYGYDFPLVSDRDERIRQLYEVGNIPLLGQKRCVFVIDASGTVIYAKRGNRPTAEIVEALKSSRR
ncbi:peroxiredoxin [Paenibacillus piri]|uniref:thioredoxin-dependent peroxiredoxin n=1 Tax=Paenibacillus piri TaxID=2547395 RepID=A0A4R5KLR9_9BACL|nr:peroxiredoxin [Paenibacillus piri]TDF95845.1 peroxiredoxin [Paenibacillus piri]